MRGRRAAASKRAWKCHALLLSSALSAASPVDIYCAAELTRAIARSVVIDTQLQARFPEAFEELQSAQRLDPCSPNVAAALSWVNYLSRQYDRARSLAEETIAQNPNSFPALQQLGQAYVGAGRYDEAIPVFQKARALSGNSTFAVARLGHALARAGGRKEAERLRVELEESANRSFGVAWVYLGLGDHERALEWLQMALNDRASELIYLKVDPIYDDLRGDARFTTLLRRVGLAN